MKTAWLAEYDWNAITEINSNLCFTQKALHKPTSDGHDACQQFWEATYKTPMLLDEAVEHCRKCHRLAPFCFYNGNTFVAVIRDVLNRLLLPADLAYTMRSLAGHIVAGTDQGDELKQFSAKCRQLEIELKQSNKPSR